MCVCVCVCMCVGMSYNYVKQHIRCDTITLSAKETRHQKEWEGDREKGVGKDLKKRGDSQYRGVFMK